MVKKEDVKKGTGLANFLFQTGIMFFGILRSIQLFNIISMVC